MNRDTVSHRDNRCGQGGGVVSFSNPLPTSPSTGETFREMRIRKMTQAMLDGSSTESAVKEASDNWGIA